MILKKPYAFLIKHFKVIHLVITVLLCLVIYNGYSIYNFFNAYVQSNYTTSITINGRPETTTYSYNEKSGLITMPPQYLGKYFIRTICGNKLIANYWEYYPEYGDDYPEEEESYWGAIFTKK